MKLQTFLSNYIKNNKTNSIPIIKGTTIINKNYNNYKNNYKNNIINYGINGNRLNKWLTIILSKIENSKYCLLYPSGLNALALIYLTLIKNKNKIIIPKNIYKPNFNLIKKIKSNIKFKTIIYPYNINKKLIKKIIKLKKVKLIMIELPDSITLKTPNINLFKKLSIKLNSIFIIDNTYSSGINYKPFNKNIFNCSIQALTKYHSGYNDIFMGCINFNTKKIFNKFYNIYKKMGITVPQEDCYQLIKSITCLYIRLKEHNKNIIKFIKWINKIPLIKKINPSNKIKKFIKNLTSLVSIKFKKIINNINIIKNIKYLQYFKIGYSWGGNISLITINKFNKYIILRIAIGLENIKELIYDFKKYIKRLINTINKQ